MSSYCGASKAGGDPEPSCPRPDELVGGDLTHYFAFYDGFAQFHPECCPRSMDGTDCDDSHGANWATWQGWIGRQVEVTLSREPLATVSGVLLKLNCDGEVDVREDDGRIAYCWPALDVRLRGDVPQSPQPTPGG